MQTRIIWRSSSELAKPLFFVNCIHRFASLCTITGSLWYLLLHVSVVDFCGEMEKSNKVSMWASSSLYCEQKSVKLGKKNKEEVITARVGQDFYFLLLTHVKM